jgi:hypothetical protein
MKGAEGVHIRESEHRQMGYAEDFKTFIEKHKDEHLIDRFRKLEKKLESEPPGTVLKDGELVVKVRGYSNKRESVYFKVQFEDKAFFVKQECLESQSLDEKVHHSVNELKALESAKKILNGMTGVSTVDSQLAFKDEQKSYFVSRWMDLPRLYDYMYSILPKRCSSIELDDKQQELITRVQHINRVLDEALPKTNPPRRFIDCIPVNIFYDSESDTIVLYDLLIANLGS